MNHSKKGFTLIELLAVIVVLGIILAIAIPKITESINNSKIAAFEDQKKIMLKVARDYIQIHGDDDGSNDGMLTYGFLKSKSLLKPGIKDDKGKLLDDNTLIDIKLNEVANLGSPNTIINKIFDGSNLEKYRIYGNSITNNGVTTSLGETGNFTIVSCGKNLFDKTKSEKAQIDAGGYNSSAWPYGIRSNYIKVNPNTAYTISGLTNYMSWCFMYDKNKTFVTRTGHQQYPSGLNFTTLENVEYIRFSVDLLGEEERNIFYVDNNIQLELGSKSTSYELYKKQITTIDLIGHESLRSLDNIKDYIEYPSNKLVRKIGVRENGELYVLDEPIIENITLPSIPTYDGVTNIIIPNDGTISVNP